jgi:hypothetical protein
VRATLGLRRLGGAQAAEDGLRYRPVAWTVIAILAVAWYLPGRVDRVAAPEIAAAPSPVTTAVPSSPPPPEQEQPPAPEITGSPAAPSFDPFAPPPSGDPDPSGFTPSPTVPATDAPPGDALTVRESGWATRLPPTPLPGDDVPDDALPVANRIGTVDRVSFIRLAGNATTLTLAEHTDSAREALGPAAVAVCAIGDASWSAGPEQSFDDAPEWDEDSCVGGTESGDRWTFDLSSFDDPAGDAGFALVPTTAAPADFQIAFVVS